MKEGWLERVLDEAERQLKRWPAWMKRIKEDALPRQTDKNGCCPNCGAKFWKRRIHIGDLVTTQVKISGRGKKEVDLSGRFFKVIGQKKVGSFEDIEGFWHIKDIANGEKFEAFGIHLTVWRPYFPPEKIKKTR